MTHDRSYRTTRLTSRSGKRILQTRHLNVFAYCLNKAKEAADRSHSDIPSDVFFNTLEDELAKLNPDFDRERWSDAVFGEVKTLVIDEIFYQKKEERS